MTRQLLRLASMAATLLLPALSGCAYLHKESPAPVPITAQGPSLVDPPVAPLYSELTQGNTSLPDLPSPPPPSAQPAPPPASVIADTTKKPAHPARHHGRKGEVDVAETHERENRDKESSAPEVAAALPEGQNLKVTAPTPSGDTSQPTPIGQLTAGPTQDTAGSRQQAADLIDSTQRGVNSLRNLNGDQYKTVAQIRSFLDQAQRALHNGDIDGAHTLATKARTLLDELTGAS
ncbi:MAG TPA: hypothetical protein VGG59_13450 [Acidobacteriaceae bacterium]